MALKNYYRVLGLSNCAAMENVKRAYRKLALAHHPDRGGDQEKMKEINEAYEFLVRHKEQYDRQFKPARRHVPQEGFTIIVGGFGWTYDVATSNATTGSTAGSFYS